MGKFLDKVLKKKGKEPSKSGKKLAQRVENSTKLKTSDRALKVKLNHEDKPKSARMTKHKNAFDALFLHKLLQDECEETVDPCASVFLEGVLQYLAAELMELSYNKAKTRAPDAKICIITSDDVKMAIQDDDELSYLIKVEENNTNS